MKCENCGAPMRVNPDRGCFTCPYCATDWVPQPNFEGVFVLEEADADCPLGHGRLQKAKLLGHGILYCTQCEGMLVPISDFVPLVEDLRASRSAPPYTGHPPGQAEFERQLNCPLCQGHMDAHRYNGPGNVVMDSCEPCSVHWLDQGEVRKIALAPDRHYAV
jgi:Zn-finger nucleic acid-binding protein